MEDLANAEEAFGRAEKLRVERNLDGWFCFGGWRFPQGRDDARILKQLCAWKERRIADLAESRREFAPGDFLVLPTLFVVSQEHGSPKSVLAA